MLSVTGACLAPAACSSSPTEIVLTTISSTFTGNIYVGRAVNNPGIYPFRESDTLAELVAAAGGLKSGASLSDIALSIPDPAASSSQRIDINTADAWLLAALPDIGDTRAADIVAFRQASGPFRSVTDLMKVKGIGQATLDKIRDFVTVGG
jgi:competence protein ComEA